jgi:PKD repeat protein
VFRSKHTGRPVPVALVLAAALVAAVLAVGAASAPADPVCETSWVGGEGLWSDTGKWTAGVPDASIVACIEAAGGSAVTVDPGAEAGGVVVGGPTGDDVQQLLVAGNTLTVTDDLAAAPGSHIGIAAGAGKLVVGGTATIEGTLDVALADETPEACADLLFLESASPVITSMSLTGATLTAGRLFPRADGLGAFLRAIYTPGSTTPSATAGDGKATVSWAALPAACSNVTYTVAAVPRGGGATVTRETSDTSVEVDGLDNAKTYDVTVTAANDAGPGAPSVAVAVDTNAVPTVGISYAPSAPNEGEPITFTANVTDPDEGDTATVAWDLDNDGDYETPGNPVSQAFPPGPHTVGVKVTDGEGLDAVSSQSFGVNALPTATINGPTTGRIGFSYSFTIANPEDPDGTTPTWAWDKDGDGAFDDGDNAFGITRTFGFAGPRSVRVRLTDSSGATRIVEHIITIAENRPPDAGFSVAPVAPVVGEPVTLTQTSTDPDGDPIVSARWDLDADGQYDAEGLTITHAFPRVGGTVVTVEVTDVAGGVATQNRFVNVRPAGVVPTLPTVRPATPVVPKAELPATAGTTQTQTQANGETGTTDDVGTPLQTVRESLEIIAGDLSFDGIRALLANPLVEFVAPGAGVARHSVEAAPSDLRKASAAAARRVVIASGRRAFSKAGIANVRLRSTRRGRAVLQKARRLRVTIRTTFTPTGGRPVVRTRKVVLRKGR